MSKKEIEGSGKFECLLCLQRRIDELPGISYGFVGLLPGNLAKR